MAPSHPKQPKPASALIEVKSDHLARFVLPLDCGDLFLLRLDLGEHELLAPEVPQVGRRFRAYVIPADLYNQRLALGPGHVVPNGRLPRIDVFGSDLARLDFEIAGADERGRALTLVSGMGERWPKARFEFGR